MPHPTTVRCAPRRRYSTGGGWDSLLHTYYTCLRLFPSDNGTVGVQGRETFREDHFSSRSRPSSPLWCHIIQKPCRSNEHCYFVPPHGLHRVSFGHPKIMTFKIGQRNRKKSCFWTALVYSELTMDSWAPLSFVPGFLVVRQIILPQNCSKHPFRKNKYRQMCSS